VPADRVAAQAFSSFNHATLVDVDEGAVVEEPIEIVVTGPGEGATAYGHLQVRVGELAEAVVVIDQRGSGTYADNVEFVIGDSARLTVVSIADWADDAVNVSTHHAALGKDAGDDEKIKRGKGVIYWQISRTGTLDSTIGKTMGKKRYKSSTTTRNLRTIDKVLR